MAAKFRYSEKNPLHPISFIELDAMHTHMELLLTGLEREQGEHLAASVEQRVKAMERRFNRFDMKSPLAVLNSRAAAESVAVDDELFMALELCEVFRVATRGYFSVATSTSTLRGSDCPPRATSRSAFRSMRMHSIGGDL